MTLVSLGAANANVIAQTARINRGDTYRQLKILQKKTLVIKILNVPNEYKPIGLNEAIRVLIQQRNKENAEKSAEIYRRAKALSKKDYRQARPKKDDNRISVIPSGEYFLHFVLRANELVQKEWVLYTQIERIPLIIDSYRESIKKTFERGVKWRIIAELNKPKDPILGAIKMYTKEFPGFIMRYVNPTLLCTFAIRDGEELDIVFEEHKGLTDSPALLTNNLKIVNLVKDYFELRWNAAMKEYPKKGIK